jgi:hypothetical protein
MQVQFHCRHADAGPLGRLVARRVRFALRRLAWLVQRAAVVLAADESAHPVLRHRCTLEIETLEGRRIVVDSRGRDSATALDCALRRAERSLRKAWRRSVEAGFRAAAPASIR